MRYRKSLGNLILTDYLEFRFYVQGEKTDTIVIAEKTPSGLIAKAGNYDRLKNLLISFSAFEGQTITTSEKLATMMAQKAILMRDVFAKVVVDKTTHPNTLRDQWASFKEILLHDMTEAQFADVYAQTVLMVYLQRVCMTRVGRNLPVPRRCSSSRQQIHFCKNCFIMWRAVIWIHVRSGLLMLCVKCSAMPTLKVFSKTLAR